LTYRANNACPGANGAQIIRLSAAWVQAERLGTAARNGGDARLANTEA
jgi:hypothetical protein